MKLVLISLDAVWGEDWERLRELPHIGPLLQSGLRCRRVQAVYPTLTYPVHVSMVTGCSPRLHGISHNQPFDPARTGGLAPGFAARLQKAGLAADDYRPWHWDHRDIKVPTLFDLCAQAGKKTCAILWPVTGKHRGIRWNFPEVLAMPWESQVLKMLRYGSAPWILAMEIRYGRQRQSTQEPDLSDYAAILAAAMASRRRSPDLMAVHLADCDAMRHRWGAHSPQAEEALIRLDRRVGRIQAALKAGGHEDDTAICLVSDHGQEDVDQPVALGRALQEKGFHVQAQSLGRGAYLHAAPEFEGEMPTLRAYLEENREALGVGAVYGPQELAALGGPREVSLAVDGGPGVVFADGLAEGKREKATHGFGTDHPAAQCLLSLTGPGIPAAELPRLSVQDIAPLAAHVLGIPWPAGRGNDPLKMI